MIAASRSGSGHPEALNGGQATLGPARLSRFPATLPVPSRERRQEQGEVNLAASSRSVSDGW
jgi:hypothetical protein